MNLPHLQLQQKDNKQTDDDSDKSRKDRGIETTDPGLGTGSTPSKPTNDTDLNEKIVEATQKMATATVWLAVLTAVIGGATLYIAGVTTTIFLENKKEADATKAIHEVNQKMAKFAEQVTLIEGEKWRPRVVGQLVHDGKEKFEERRYIFVINNIGALTAYEVSVKVFITSDDGEKEQTDLVPFLQPPILPGFSYQMKELTGQIQDKLNNREKVFAPTFEFTIEYLEAETKDKKSQRYEFNGEQVIHWRNSQFSEYLKQWGILPESRK